MIPVERKKRIRQLIQTEKTLKINELSERFNVSDMTIHRDIKPLVEEGLVTKTSGGIALVEKDWDVKPAQSHCIYCHKPNHAKMVYRLILPNDELETACCAHCGLLRHRQLGDGVSHAICHDFLMNTTISASVTWYVMDTSLNIACCHPQVLTFENKEHAEKFVTGFGGNIYGFYDAMEAVGQKMHDDTACSHQDGWI